MLVGKCAEILVQIPSLPNSSPHPGHLISSMGTRSRLELEDFLLGKQLASVGAQTICAQYRGSFLPRGMLSTEMP